MAKKKVNLDSLYAGNGPSWAASIGARNTAPAASGQDVNEDRKWEAFAKEAIADIRRQGVEVSSADEARAVRDTIANKEFNFTPTAAPVLPTKADFSGVSATVTQTPATENVYDLPVNSIRRNVAELGNVVDAVQAGAQRSLAAGVERAAASDNPLFKFMAQLPGAAADLVSGDLVGLITERAQGKRSAAADAGLLRQDAQENDDATLAFRESLKGRDAFTRNLGEGILDAAASPSGAASLFGGPVGAVAVLDAYNQSYAAGTAAGLEGDELEAWAMTQAAPELVSLIPANKFLERIPFLKKTLFTPAKKAAAGLADRIANPAIQAGIKTAKTVGGEIAEEVTTGSIQDVAAAAFAGAAASEEGRALGEQQAPDTVGEFAANRVREARAAAVMAGGFSAAGLPKVQSDYNKAVAEQGDTTTKAATDAGLAARDKARTREIAVDAELNKELFAYNEEQRIREEKAATDKAKQAAFDQAERDGAEQRRLEEEAGFRTIERDKDLPESRVERYADVVERTPVSPAAEITPEQVADSEAAALVDEADRVDRVELGGITEELRKVQQTEQKKAEKKAAEEETKKKAAETKRRREIQRQVLAENPGKDISELAPIVRERLAATPAPAVEIAPDSAAPKAPDARKEFFKEKARAKRANAAVAPEPTKPDANVELDDIAKTLGLNMSGPANVSASKDTDADYVKKATEVVKSLAAKQDQKSVDIQNLMRQGKLIIATNPESVGRKAGGSAAEFVPGEGTMYLYTDGMDTKDAGAAAIRALHESTHAGQFNDRQDRPSVFVQMMSQNGNNKASNAIRKAAEGGNKLAQAAVRQAQAASPDTDIQDLELVPYFVGEAVESRATTFGQLGGVVKDIKSGARSMLRKAGLDLDLSLDDINSAAQKVAGEIVDTAVAPTDGPDVAMVVQADTATGQRLRSKGIKSYVDVDGRTKVIVSDADSKLDVTPDIKKTLHGGQGIRVGDMLSNPTIKESYPELERAVVYADPGTPGASWMHTKNPDKRELRINPTLLDLTDEGTLHDYILHELQHGIQHIEGFGVGGNPQQFRTTEDKALVAKQQRTVEAFNENVKNLSSLQGDSFEHALHARDLRYALEAYERKDFGPERLAHRVDRLVVNSPDRFAVNLSKEMMEQVKTLKELAPDIDEMNLRTEAEYTSLLGEQESTFVEKNRKKLQAELPDRVELMQGTRLSRKAGDPGIELDLDQDLALALPIRSTPESLSMATPTSAQKPAKHRVPVMLTGLVDAAKGLPRNINEILEHAMSSPAGARMVSEATMGRYNRALHKEAANRGMTPEALNKQIGVELDAAVKDTSGHAQNKAAFDAAAAPYGEAGAALIRMRDQVDDLTMEILRQRAASGIPLSADEKTLYTTMFNNLGRYTHRQYASMQGKAGKAFANDVWNDFQKYKKGTARTNPTVAANYDRVAKGIGAIIDNSLYIPDEAAMQAASADKIAKLYATWVGPDRGDGKDAKVAALLAVRDTVNGDKEAMNRAAEEITKELIGLAESKHPITSYYRGGKQDTGILQKRENVPPAIRELMGEITDPSMRLLLTVAKQAEFVGRNKMLLELAQSGTNELAAPGTLGQEGTEGWATLSGEGYGPLQGWRASPNMFAAIGDVQQQLATFEQAVAMSANKPKELADKILVGVSDAWGAAASFSKVAQITLNPFNFLFNFVGGPMMMLTNGNVNPVNLAKGVKGAVQLIAYAMNQHVAYPAAVELARVGVVDSAFIGEIKGEQYRELRKVIGEMSGHKDLTATRILKDVWAASKSGWIETYAMMDVMFKIANYYQQKSTLEGFYKANGETKTDEQIQREAAEITSRTNFTFKRVAPLMKAIERKGFSAFGPYMHEVVRTQVTNVLQGLGELQRANQAKTPAAKALMALQGSRRLTGQVSAWGLTAAAATAMTSAVFGDDEDEERAKRSLLPDYVSAQDFVQVGVDEQGKPVYMQMSRLDPVGPITDIMREALVEDEIDVAAIGKKLLDFYVIPRLGPQVLKAVGLGGKINRVPLVQQKAPEVYSELLDAGNKIGLSASTIKGWTNVAEAMAPGIAGSWRDENPRVTTDTVEGAGINALSYLGLRLFTPEPEESLSFAAKDYTSALKAGRTELTEMFSDNPDRTPAEVTERLAGARQTEKEAYDQARLVYVGATLSGLTPREAKAKLVEGGMAQKDANAVAKGEFSSELISKSSIKYYETEDLKEAKSPEEKKEVKQLYRDMWDILRDVQEGNE